jgi:hypothetical protein
VLDDREAARRIGFRGQRFFVESIDHWARNGPVPNPEIEDDNNEAHLREEGERRAARTVSSYVGSEKIEVAMDAQHAGGQHHYNLYQAYGTVNDAIEYVERLRDAGADEIMFLMQMGTVPHEVILETIRNIGQHVLPYFRKQEQVKAWAN